MKRLLLLCICTICAIAGQEITGYTNTAYATDGSAKITCNGTWLYFNGLYYCGSTQSVTVAPTFSCSATISGVRYDFGYTYPTWALAHGYPSYCYEVGIKAESSNFQDAGYRLKSSYAIYESSGNTSGYPCPTFKWLIITGYGTGDLDQDGVPDDEDSDPNDPDKGRDSDHDGVEDDEDCDAHDPANKHVKPNCYRCDDGGYKASSGACDDDGDGLTNDIDTDDDGDGKPDWVEWKKQFKDSPFITSILDKLSEDRSSSVITISISSMTEAFGLPLESLGTWKVSFSSTSAPVVTAGTAIYTPLTDVQWTTWIGYINLAFQIVIFLGFVKLVMDDFASL